MRTKELEVAWSAFENVYKAVTAGRLGDRKKASELVGKAAVDLEVLAAQLKEDPGDASRPDWS